MKVNLFYFFLGLFLVFMVASTVYYPLRYLKYTLPLFALPFFLKKKEKFTVSGYKYYYYQLFFYLALIILSFLRGLLQMDIAVRFLPNCIFILAPLLFFLLIQPFYNENQKTTYIRVILYASIFMFFISEGADLWSVISQASFVDAILSSEFPTESNLAYVFGFLFLYFFIEKYPLKYKIISLLFLILCFKRVVLGATLLSLIVNLIISLFKINVTKRRIVLVVFALIVNLLFIQIAIVIVDGVYDQNIYERTGFSLDRLLMGRKTFYSLALNNLGDFSWFGAGIGKIDDIIYDFYGIPINLHSEVLRNYLEFGIIFFILWIIVIFYQTTFSVKSTLFLFYLNILLLTDNVFIYFEIMFIFYLFVQVFMSEVSAKIKRERYD